jgi:YD repeat-containing protein
MIKAGSSQVQVINGIQDTYSYGYSDLNELTKVTKNGALLRTYNYDANGNRLGITMADGKVILASYDSQDRLMQFGSNTPMNMGKMEKPKVSQLV